MEYQFNAIEQKWQEQWKKTNAYKVPNVSDKPKYYVLDMFPYPSGAGLHVGHPLGYIASDIFSRYKRLKGYNVLHPMGYDAFGLPAEQYAIEHGVHPAISTAKNIDNFRAQLDKIGFCYDWDREVNTSKPEYYKWTQWIFLQLFNSWFNRSTQKAESIKRLIEIFEKEGNTNHPFPNEKFQLSQTSNLLPIAIGTTTGNTFSADAWQSFDAPTKQTILMEYRLAYCGYGEVNWCEALGTVLANDEVVNGVSERGGHPVVKKKLRQWYLRITEYADRLLLGLQQIDFSDAMKEMQGNWIGKSFGAEIEFRIRSGSPTEKVHVTVEGNQTITHIEISTSEYEEFLKVYTTRPDTIFGVDFMVVAPEHSLVPLITTTSQKVEVEKYLDYVNSRSDRERQAEKKISGCFTGEYAINPFDGREIPIWISEYVLAGYGTGAIMAVPCGDERDFKFAQHFGIPITNIIGEYFNGTEANATKDAVLSNSGFLNGTPMREASEIVMNKMEELGNGKRKVNYKMRDAAFSRQRYWGEPFPVQWKNGVAYTLLESELPLLLPEVDSYSPGPEGEGPLANIPEWVARELETNTMPGYAGSSWYFLRYMDPHNDAAFCDRSVSDYWNQVDLYVGGTEHAVGHLLYSRMWTKALYDLGHIGFDEPFKKLLNQGMIQGSSRFVKRIQLTHKINEGSDKEILGTIYVSQNVSIEGLNSDSRDLFKEKAAEINGKYFKHLNIPNELIDGMNFTRHHVDVNIVDGYQLDLNAFRNWKAEYSDAEFVFEDGTSSVGIIDFSGKEFLLSAEVEKMSKSKFNTVNPDDLVARYGADTFRMYEMFLGPVEISKPWDTKGIEGVHRFLKKLWRLYFDELKGLIVTHDAPTADELKVLHKTIKKIEDDTERFSFNTAVSAFMVCVNELSDLKCRKKAILEPLAIMLTPYAPHIAAELYEALGNQTAVIDATYPVFNASHVVESTKEYPVSINGKLRTTLQLPAEATQDEAQAAALANEVVIKWLEGKPVKKFIFVKGRMINVVI